MTPLIRLVTRATLLIALLTSMTYLVGGDQGPGDGFSAGVVSALGLTLQYIAFGYHEARRTLRRFRFERMPPVGLAIALLAALLPVVTGEPLLAILEVHMTVPLVGVVRLTRALLFDVGIYLVVGGGAMTVIESLGRAIA
ncbi:MAG: hypothetical protein HY689_05630 [Chloroflexi bacterium]|nr:hypothetical protein [Chloroflexota bacterium]